MTLYEKNIQELKSKYPIIYDAIKSVGTEDVSDIAHIEDARKGGQVVVYHDNGKDVYLNSKYDPENEAAKYMAETFEMQDEAILIMFGLSNGYYVKEHIKHAKGNTKCIIFEPSFDIFIQVILHVDISELIKSKRVCLVVEGINTEGFSAAIEEWLDMANKDANKLLAAPKYMDLFHESYEAFRESCMEMYKRLYMLANIVVDYGTEEVKNEIHNMKFLAGCRLASELKGRFPEDMPAIVVSAGPSLEKNVELLREAKGKAFIFVVDAAIPAVMELGIKPDAIISIDCGRSAEHFKWEGISELPFFVNINSSRSALDYVSSRNLFFFASDSPVYNELFSSMGRNIPTMDMGGSVATAAIANLISWGIKRIILIGQDLALTGNRIHVGENTIEINEDAGIYKQVKDIDGNDVVIRFDYYMYLKWIEKTAFAHRDIEFIDATEGGAFKKNLRQMTLKDVIEKYCTCEYNISEILLSLPRLFEGNDSRLIIEALEKMKNDFKKMKKQLISCKADCLRGKKILENGLGNVSVLNQINNNIIKTVNLIKNSDESDCIYKWTAGAEFDILKGNNKKIGDEESAIQKFQRNARYFDQLANAMPALIKIVDECLAELNCKK